MTPTTVDPNPKLQKVYQYLRKNNAVKSPTYEDFEAKMQDPKTMARVFNYLKDNGKLKAHNVDEFQTSMGLKKKDNTSLQDSTTPSGAISEPQVLESGLTEEQERERNLQHLAQQPVASETQDVSTQPAPENAPLPSVGEQMQQQLSGEPIQQPEKEPLGFLDTLGAIWADLKRAKETPAKPGDKPHSPIINALQRGTLMAEQASLLNPFEGTDLGEGETKRIAEIQKETTKFPASEEYQKFNQSGTVGGALSALAESPVKIIGELTTESMSALLQYGASRMGAGAAMGATIGSVVPGIGTAAGAGAGVTVGMASSSLGLEYSGKFVESLQEQGVDVQNPEDLKRAFESEDIISEARSSALKKGIPIAIFDLISGGIAGKIVSKPAKSLIGKIGQGAAEFGVQAGAGGIGETAGQVVAGEKINPSAIIAEMVGELGTTPIEVSNALLTFNRKPKSDGGQAVPVEAERKADNTTAAQPITDEVKQETSDDKGTDQPVGEVAPEPKVEPATQKEEYEVIPRDTKNLRNGKNFDYLPSKSLSESEKQLETKFADDLNENFDQRKKEYISKFGNVLDADNAKELSEEYVANPQANASAVHNPGSSFLFKVYTDALNEPAPKGKKNLITFVTGGAGAGKTTLTDKIKTDDQSQIIYNTFFGELQISKNQINRALNAGKDVDVKYVYRDPVESFDSMIKRSEDNRRLVPIKTFIKSHVDSKNTIEKIKSEYDGNPRVNIETIGTPKDIDEKSLQAELTAKADKLLTDGKITPEQYTQLIGKKGGGDVIATTEQPKKPKPPKVTPDAPKQDVAEEVIEEKSVPEEVVTNKLTPKAKKSVKATVEAKADELKEQAVKKSADTKEINNKLKEQKKDIVAQMTEVNNIMWPEGGGERASQETLLERLEEVKKLGYEVDEGYKIIFHVKDDGVIKIGFDATQEALDRTKAEFPERIDQKTPFKPNKSYDSPRRTTDTDRAEQRGSLEANKKRLDTAKSNLAEAIKVGNKKLEDVFAKEVEREEKIFKAAKSINWERIALEKEMNSNEEAKALIQASGEIQFKNFYQELGYYGFSTEDYAFAKQNNLLGKGYTYRQIKTLIDADGKPTEQYIRELEQEVFKNKLEKDAVFLKKTGSGYRQPKNNREEWDWKNLNSAINRDENKIEILKSIKDAPKTEPTKSPDVPAATETSAEGSVERTESTDEKYATMKKKQSDTIASAAKKWDALSESDQENIKKLAKSWQLEDLIPKRDTPKELGAVEREEQESEGKQLKDVEKQEFVRQTLEAAGLSYDDVVMWRQSVDRLPENLDVNLHKRIISDAIKRGEQPMMALSTADMLTVSIAEDPNFENLRAIIKRGGDVSDSVKFFEENGIKVPEDIKNYSPKFKKGDKIIIDSTRRTDNGKRGTVDAVLPDGRVSVAIHGVAKKSFTNLNQDQIKLQESGAPTSSKENVALNMEFLGKEYGSAIYKKPDGYYISRRGVIEKIRDQKRAEKAFNEAKEIEKEVEAQSPEEKKSKIEEAKTKLAERARKVKDKFNDLYDENLGIAFDPKARAKKHYEFHRELVGLAKDAIELGIATVEEFAESIGRKVDDFLTRAFEDAQREVKGEPVAVKSQKFFEGMEPSSEQRENLSQAIETDQEERSDYVKRRIKDIRDNKTFKKDSTDIGYYNVQSMELANTESDKLIADLQNALGDKAGLLAAFNALKENQIPPLMEGPLASKLMLRMQALRMNKTSIEVLDWLQEGGRDAARRLASLQAAASPESTVSRMFAGLEKVKQDALSKPFKGKTYLDVLKDLQDQLTEVQRKYDDLLENGTFDKSMLPEPEKQTDTQRSKELVKRARSLRAEGISDLNKFFKKSRGQANMGLAVDPDLFKALAKIMKSYLLEFEGNMIGAYEKFRKDVSAQYPIKATDLDQMKTDLLNANRETIEEFKAKKQMQVVDKMLAPEGKETPEQRKKRRETAKKIIKDFNDGVDMDAMAENFADIAQFETVSPEDKAKIVEMTSRYAQYNAEGKNELAYKAWYDLMMFLEDLGLQQRSAHETVLDLWYTGVLSGLTTIARSIKGSMLSTSNFTITRLMANPKVAPLAIASMIKGLRGAGGTYRHIMTTGKTTVKLQDFSPRLPRLTDRLWDKSFGDLKTRDKFLKGLYALPTFMYRNIIAFDQILKDAVAEGNIAVFEFNSTKEEKTLSDRLKKTQERLQNLRNKEVDALVAEEIDVMQKAGEEIPVGYKDRRFRELKNEMRNADHVRRAVEDAARASLVSHPVGSLGQFYSYWERMMEIQDSDAHVTKGGKYLLRSIFPFMRIGFNYVNAGLDYTPVGFYRSLKNSIWTKDGIRPVEGFERREYFVRASLGLAAYVTLLATMFDWDEDEGLKLKAKKDRWIEIYGPLTGKWWEYDDVAKDARPWSMRLKNPFTGEWSGVFSYADNPIGFMLAPLGIMHDEIMFTDFKDKVEKKELKHEVKDMAYLVGAGVHGTFRYAMDQSFNQGLNTIGNLMAPESPEKFGKEVENLVLRPTQGFYPSIYRQMYDQYRALSDTPEKQANHWYEKPAKLMPFVDNIIKNEKYDVFGYPIRRDFNVPLIPDMVLKMAKDNLDYRDDLKEWNLVHKFEEVTIGGSFLPPQTHEGKELTDAQKDEYARVAGIEMRRLVNSHWEALKEMDAARLQKRLLKYKSTARKRATRDVLK